MEDEKRSIFCPKCGNETLHKRIEDSYGTPKVTGFIGLGLAILSLPFGGPDKNGLINRDGVHIKWRCNKCNQSNHHYNE